MPVQSPVPPCSKHLHHFKEDSHFLQYPGGTWKSLGTGTRGCEVGFSRPCPLIGLPEEDGPPLRMLGPGQVPSSQAKSHSMSCHLALCQKSVSQAAGKPGTGAAPPARSCPRGHGLIQGKHQIFREEVGSGSERESKTPPLGS